MAYTSIYVIGRAKKRIEALALSIYQIGTFPIGMTDDDYELYKRFEQCTEIYHCTPLELDNQDSFELESQWILYNKKREIVQKKQAKSQGINRVDANKSNTFGV